MQVVAAREREDGPRRQRGRVTDGPGAPDHGRLAAGELDDAAAVDAEQGGDAPRGEHEDIGLRDAGGHDGRQLAHDGVLLGEARQQHAAGEHDEGERAEDEHGAERVRDDALRARMGVVEQRQLVADDGADRAHSREAARQEAGGVDDDEDRDLLDRRVEAARGVDGERGADQRPQGPGRQDPGGQGAPVQDEDAQQPVDDADHAQWSDEPRVRERGAREHEQQQRVEPGAGVEHAADAPGEQGLAAPQGGHVAQPGHPQRHRSPALRPA